MNGGMTAQIVGGDDVFNAFNRLTRLAPGLTMKAIDATGLAIESKAKENCTTGVSGLLRASIHYKRDEKTLSGEVDVNQAYGPYVEFGTAPHMPPLEAIQLWVNRVLGADSADDNGEKYGGENDFSPEVWAVAMAIKENGTQAQPFLFPAAESERENYKGRLASNYAGFKP